MQMTRDQFHKSVIAQADDEDWQESGYVAGEFDGVAFIGRYGHCSCYGTFDDLCGVGIGDYVTEGNAVFDWTGPWAQLVEMAKRRADPAMPDRIAEPGDCDFLHLQSVYRQIIECDKARQAA